MRQKRQNLKNQEKIIPTGPESEKTIILPSRTQKNLVAVTGQTTAFTRALAAEIVRNLTTFGQFTTRPFRKLDRDKKPKNQAYGDFPVLVDTSILIDGRILPVVNSGFFSGTLIITKFVLSEVQHIADSADAVRRAKGRRGLEVAAKLKGQKTNDRVRLRVIADDVETIKEVDHKLVQLAKKHAMRLLTLDFNLAQYARAQGVKVMNINDLAQAMKVALLPGEECDVKISHEGKEREQGVGYLDDGTMVIVEQAKDKVGSAVRVTIQKIHQTPAGQLFFARLA